MSKLQNSLKISGFGFFFGGGGFKTTHMIEVPGDGICHLVGSNLLKAYHQVPLPVTITEYH